MSRHRLVRQLDLDDYSYDDDEEDEEEYDEEYGDEEGEQAPPTLDEYLSSLKLSDGKVTELLGAVEQVRELIGGGHADAEVADALLYYKMDAHKTVNWFLEKGTQFFLSRAN